MRGRSFLPRSNAFCQDQTFLPIVLSRSNAFCQGQTFFADRSIKIILLLLRSNRKSKKIRRTILIISTFSVTNRSFPDRNGLFFVLFWASVNVIFWIYAVKKLPMGQVQPVWFRGFLFFGSTPSFCQGQTWFIRVQYLPVVMPVKLRYFAA